MSYRTLGKRYGYRSFQGNGNGNGNGENGGFNLGSLLSGMNVEGLFSSVGEFLNSCEGNCQRMYITDGQKRHACLMECNRVAREWDLKEINAEQAKKKAGFSTKDILTTAGLGLGLFAIIQNNKDED